MANCSYGLDFPESCSLHRPKATLSSSVKLGDAKPGSLEDDDGWIVTYKETDVSLRQVFFTYRYK